MPWQLNIEGSRGGIFRALTQHGGEKGAHGYDSKNGDREPGRWYVEWMDSYPADHEDPDDVNGHITIQTLDELREALNLFLPNGKVREDTYITGIELHFHVRANEIEAWGTLNRQKGNEGGSIDIRAEKQSKIIDAAKHAHTILKKALEMEDKP